ncbi:MAG: type II toxin-antitoxin system HicA family toxin [Burkholderiales bacterium]
METLLRQNDWTFDHQTGSHRIWRSSSGVVISLQKARNGKAKGYQVEQFLKHVE